MTHDTYQNQWKEWNSLGFIPGPDEDEQSYIKRINYCLTLKEHLTKNNQIELPFDDTDQNSQKFLENAFPQTKDLYGIRPSWVLLFLSNYQLKPWQGGCAWIFQMDENSPTSAFIQLRKQFSVSPTYLKIYDRNELLMHECAHIGRMVYQEPKFEEFFAYQSSTSKFRQWFGPFIQSSKESLLFVLILGIVIFADLAYLATGHGMHWVHWLKLFPILMIFGGLLRLILRHDTLRKCRLNLEFILNPLQTRHLMYRLRDDEIESFARFSKTEILDFIEKEKNHSFRWKFLNDIYF
ncbi:MAG: hypothetical protein Q8K60_02270 [Parachlamydiaceae bacterium]|nr:hypothetical protein [Parachlamydiaceae bacterium]